MSSDSNEEMQFLFNDRTYESVVTTIGSHELGHEIMTHLQNRPFCGAMFNQSCFGDYVNIRQPLSKTSFVSRCEESFRWVSNVTLYYVTILSFRERVFQFVPLPRSVSVADLTHVFNNLLHQLSNKDVVRVSLLYMLEQGCLGKYPGQLVTNERMALVSNLQEFNRLIWDFTYKEMCTVFDKIEEHLNPNVPRIGSRHTYTLEGFVYAFKIWVLETFHNNSIVGSIKLGVISRAAV
uniref:Uncharacterized protein n=1 Tax=Lactuca sativa TaxID=4236 RepID=A0A9R1UTY1_LACSA|nr:hypothetical protein LSAT_V11C800406560 [Lactuca sativa]